MDVVVVAVVAALAFLVTVWVRRARRAGRGLPRFNEGPEAESNPASRVRVHRTGEEAVDARARALRQELTSLERETQHAEEHGLHHRADRLREVARRRQAELEEVEQSRSADARETPA